MDDLAFELVDLLKMQGKTVTTVESCTGGLLSGAITGVAGSSHVFETGFITYSNAAKTELVGVSETLLAQYGAVSEPVAAAMAQGALRRAHADLALSVTGIAGPGGGSVEKPVGMVCFGLGLRIHDPQTQTVQFGNIGRSAVREASVRRALAWAVAVLRQQA